jgi:hypothetical protein
MRKVHKTNNDDESVKVRLLVARTGPLRISVLGPAIPSHRLPRTRSLVDEFGAVGDNTRPFDQRRVLGGRPRNAETLAGTPMAKGYEFRLETQIKLFGY